MYTINSKIFFFADILFLGGCLRFPLANVFFCVWLSNIRVVVHSGKYGKIYIYIYIFIYRSWGLCSNMGVPAAMVGSSQMCLNGQYAGIWWLGHK